MTQQADVDTPHFWRTAPRAELSGLVSGIYGYAERGERMVDVVEAASLTVPLIINFGSPFRIALGRRPGSGDRIGSFAAGLHAGPVMMDSEGDAQCVQVNFTPLGGHRFFGLPMGELADRMVPIADLGDRGISELARRLGDLNAWDSRLALVEHWVAGRLLGSAPSNTGISWALRAMADARGDIRIASLAGRLGWSRRIMVERFRREIGLPPKAVARILRFNHALELTRGSDALADIAAACGYADQAHLTREFAVLAGTTPSGWRAAA